MYKRILVPVDGSATSNKALLVALDLARLKGARVRLVHVPEVLAASLEGKHGAPLRQALEAGSGILHRALALADAAEVQADIRLRDAPDRRLGEVVAEEAAHWPADLVVVGTHGRHGVSRLLLGSGAEQIVRLAPVPVLTVRGDDPAA